MMHQEHIERKKKTAIIFSNDIVFQGDIGGPILSLDRSILYGILTQVTGNCGEGNPALALRVSAYLDWIETNSGITP